MRSGSRLRWVLLLSVGLVLLVAPSARAYVDPGTGSYVFQILVGALLAAAVSVRLFWSRIWGAVTRRSAKETSPERE